MTKPEISSEFSDSQLIEKILAGEQALFELLIRRNNPFLYKTGRSYNYNHEDTQDLMQDSFLDAYLGLAQFANRSSFRTWIIKIMLNNCFKKQQKFSYKNEKPTEISDKAIPMYTTRENTDTNKTVINHELRFIIEGALSQVPEPYRMVFSLREINGLNVIETAEALNITEANVKVRLNRAKTLLRKEIEKSYSPHEIFEFNLIYCNNMVTRVMKNIHP